MKNIFKFTAAVAGLLTLGTICSPVAKATDLLVDPADTVGGTHNNDSRLGRLSRQTTTIQVAQTWVGSETNYLGAAGPTSTYYSETFSFSAAQLNGNQYVEITEDSANANTFVSAWAGGYNLLASDTAGAIATVKPNFLGDNAQSRNYGFTGLADPRYFQVIVPAGMNLTVVVTDTVANDAAGAQPFGLVVANYSDKEYTDAIAVPEPSTWAMLGAGVLLGGVSLARRGRAKA